MVDQQSELDRSGKQTPIEPTARKTGMGEKTDTAPGAEPEAAGNDNPEVSGSPNQGTESR